jgi:nucleoid DNA-binding protein
MALTKKELVAEISKETLLRPEVISEVLETFTDIAVEELLVNGEFNIPNLVKISTYKQNKASVSTNPKDPNAPRVEVEGSLRLKSAVAVTLKKLLRIQKLYFSDSIGLIDRNSWRDALKWDNEGLSRQRTSKKIVESKTAHVSSVQNDETFGNPLLDDSYDE